VYRSNYIHKPLRRLGLAAVLTGMGVLQGVLPTHLTTATASPFVPFVLDDDAEEGKQPTPIERSRLTGMKLAANAYSAGTKEMRASVAANLNKMAEKYGAEVELDADRVEMIAWEGSSAAPRTALWKELEKGGYKRTDYEGVKNEAVKFSFFKAVGSKNTLFGMWVEDGKSILVAWGRAGAEAKPDTKAAAQEEPEEKPVKPVSKSAKPAEEDNAADEPISLQVDARTNVVNVMKSALPKIPAFPKLAKKPGFVRGYVYDTKGNPLKGAKLGARSTAAGGFYSGAQGKTDDKGYYEIEVPWGAAHFYCAGYAVDYGEGRAALGLHPADGEAEGFATAVGEVENFVMLPYGIADRDAVQDDPRYCNNYYGGNVILGWTVDSDSPIFTSPHYLPNDSVIEVTLTPDGPLVDGSRGRAIVVRKAVRADAPTQLYINNIPVGVYKITAKLVGGGALRMKETGPYANKPFGLEPKEATGKATVLLRPSSAKPESALARHGNWEQISISLERP
jgi:hypothetical protein